MEGVSKGCPLFLNMCYADYYYQEALLRKLKLAGR